MPQNEAGWRIEPPVSVPRATSHRRAETAAAEPPLEPPGTLVLSYGLRTFPKAEFSLEEPIANSSQLVLPIITASSLISFWTAVAVYTEVKSLNILEEQVSGLSFIERTSLTAITIPASLP